MLSIYKPLTSGAYYQDNTAVIAPPGAVTPPRLILTNPRSAELIKHASNSFLAMKISFINAVAAMCEAVGADIGEVCEGIGSDSRIGPRFLAPGIGYGGSCFPKDLLAFRAVAKQCGYDFGLLAQVSDINERQRERFIAKVRKALWVLKGKRLAVLGLAFKGGTDDVRDSQAVAIVKELLREDCEIVAYDPAAMTKARELFEADPATASRVRFAENAYDAAKGAHAVLVLTEWPEFAALDLARLKREMLHSIMIDGRNLFAPQAMAAHGFTYISYGRPDVLAAAHAGNRVPIPR
jgi:UDPglucose 6-dehydrogenase